MGDQPRVITSLTAPGNRELNCLNGAITKTKFHLILNADKINWTTIIRFI